VFDRSALAMPSRAFGDVGDVVVLLHGFPEDLECWCAVADLLVAQGFRVVVPSLRGYDAANSPRGIANYRADRLMADVVGLIEELDTTRVHLVGHDLGGVLGWVVASSRPDLLLTFSAVTAPHPRAWLRTFVSWRQIHHSSYMLFLAIPYLPEFMLLSFNGWLGRKLLLRSGMNSAVVQRILEKYLNNRRLLTGSLNWYRGMACDIIRGFGVRMVDVPTLVVFSDWGSWDKDLVARQTAAFVTSRFEWAVLDGVSHWVPLEAPAELVDRLVSFIRRPGGERQERIG